jgi:hypothetical protein
MNERINELYRSCKPKEALASQDLYKSADVLLGSEVKKFAELIVAECLKIAKNREDEFESAGLLEQSNAVGNVAYRISRQFGVKR